MAYRITTHKARTTKDGTAFSARHLDRHFDLKKAKHIDSTRTHLNRYVEFDVHDDGSLNHKKSKDLQGHELAVYERLFRKRLDTINERYRAQRHKERCKTLKQYYRSPQSCPDEYLIYIGDKDNHADSDTLKRAATKLISVIQSKYPDHFIPLSIALHRDELGIGEDGEGSHLHFRCVWIYADKTGTKASISQGMKAAGIQLPNEDLEAKRSNNRQMTFSQEIRDTFADICEQDFGLEIEREARDSSRAGKDLVTYQRDQALQDIQRFKNERSKIQSETALEAQRRDELAEEVAVLTKKKHRLETAVERLKAILLPIQNFFTRLSTIRLGKGRTALDELMLTNDGATAYSALKELHELDERN
ncbi:MAG: hypothetical protein IJX67_01785 [Oscillospiraceae bacterium]|nr:hypothetical protein [Oscillospiraceae bacterium]